MQAVIVPFRVLYFPLRKNNGIHFKNIFKKSPPPISQVFGRKPTEVRRVHQIEACGNFFSAGVK